MPGKWPKTARQLICMTGSLFLLLISFAAGAVEYYYMQPEELKIRIDTSVPIILVDIQNKNAYLEHHFYGSIRTHAYPAKTELDTQSLVQAVRIYEFTGNDVVIIGPLGGSASMRTHDFLVTRGIPSEKIYILKGGIRDWPYRDMLLDMKGGCY